MSSPRVLWQVTFVGRDGLRTLVGPAQGRYMHETPLEAEGALRALLATNDEARLVQVFGPQSCGTFRVDPFPCWAHGDPIRIFVD